VEQLGDHRVSAVFLDALAQMKQKVDSDETTPGCIDDDRP